MNHIFPQSITVEEYTLERVDTFDLDGDYIVKKQGKQVGHICFFPQVCLIEIHTTVIYGVKFQGNVEDPTESLPVELFEKALLAAIQKRDC